jgi:hypothetical protein
MESYKQLCKQLIEEHIEEVKEEDNEKTTEQILQDMLDNGNDDVFGNISGSRTFDAEEAKQFIYESGALYDDEILALFDQVGDRFLKQTLSRGAEVLDVTILELLSHQVINEMLEEVRR